MMTESGKQAYLLWDMAGTLIPFNQVTGVPCVLPDADQFLAELGQSFGQVVTTGDIASSARALLAGFGIAGHFQQIFGDLFEPVGKPYGAILKKLGGDPRQSLAIGDRLRADIASDTADVVTLLINQEGDTVTTGLVAHIIASLQREGPSFPEAFAVWQKKAVPAPELVGSRVGGQIVSAARLDLGFALDLLQFSHPALDGDRLIIQI
jgi:hypothetical protein